MTGQEILIALGANLPGPVGPPAATLAAAVAALDAAGLEPRRISRFHATPCFPEGAGPDYVNAALVARARTGSGAADILAVLHAVEARFGRRRETRWGGRTLDLDLLAVGGTVLPDATEQAAWRALPPERQRIEAPEALILPHPRLQERAFVLVPLSEVAPCWRHPLLGRTVTEMLADLGPAARDGIVPI